MLTLPELSKDQFTCRLLGIDNGTSLLGFTFLDYNILTGMSEIVHCETYKVPTNYKVIREAHYQDKGALQARIELIGDYYTDLLHEFEPNIVGCESPFSHLHVNSYRTLTLSMQKLDDRTYEYDRFLEFYKISPGGAKAAACKGIKYTSKKEGIHEALYDHPDLINTNGIDLTTVGPDALDSISVALALVQKVVI